MKKEITLYDDYDFSYDEYFETFKEWCVDNSIDSTKYTIESDYFNNWLQDTLQIELDALFMNLTHSQENVPCVIDATINKWNGSVNVYKKFDNLVDAIHACINGIDFCKIRYVNGVIELQCIHHDGCNLFNIYKLNKKGLKVIDTNKLENSFYHKKFSQLF